jgi:hypothetical protein
MAWAGANFPCPPPPTLRSHACFAAMGPRRLQGRHDATQFDMTLGPPSAKGMTWSTSVAGAPQYTQRWWSRSRTRCLSFVHAQRPGLRDDTGARPLTVPSLWWCGRAPVLPSSDTLVCVRWRWAVMSLERRGPGLWPGLGDTEGAAMGGWLHLPTPLTIHECQDISDRGRLSVRFAPLAWLQVAHATARLSSVWGPPSTRGMMWSRWISLSRHRFPHR